MNFYKKQPIKIKFKMISRNFDMKLLKGIFIFLMLYSSTISAQIEPINLVDLNFRMSAMEEKVLVYGFAKGDKVILNLSEERDKNIKTFKVSSYQNNGAIFSEFNVTSLNNKEIEIKNTGIYEFRFLNSSLARRIINFKIDRLPAAENTVSFDSEVKIRTIIDTTYSIRTENYVKSENYEVVELVSNQEYFINSGMNATFQDGKSRIALPINLPKNTQKWYYQISSFRENSMKDKVVEQMSLVSDLSKLIDTSGSLDFALNSLSEPPGADYCDVYLIDYNNYNPFLNKLEFRHYPVGTRENIKSGNVEIIQSFNQPIYLGIKNPDSMHGVNIVISVVAIVHNLEMATKEIKVPVINSKQELYLENVVN